MPKLQKYSTETVTFDSESGEGAQTPHTVYQANMGNVPTAAVGETSVMCDVCGLAYPESKTRVFRGVTYGIPCGCSEDIRSILQLESAKRFRPSKGKPEREARMILE